MPAERKERMRQSHIGKKHSLETRKKQSSTHLGENNPMFGKNAWEAINKIQKKCEYCGIETTPGNYGKWHGNRCKHKI
jgi:hypothetical protein